MFVNHDPRYTEWIQIIYDKLLQAADTGQFLLDTNRVNRAENLTQIFLQKEDFFLKLDFINDVAVHHGSFENNPILGRIDGWQNILSNKLAALSRLEIKDFVDIWIIAKNKHFNWRTIFEQAKQKDAGLDPIMLYELMRSIPPESLDLIKWSSQIDSTHLLHDIHTIAEDLILGRDNTLFN